MYKYLASNMRRGKKKTRGRSKTNGTARRENKGSLMTELGRSQAEHGWLNPNTKGILELIRAQTVAITVRVKQ